MSNLPEDLKYARTHEWSKREEDGTVLVGITDHAQQALGDLVYVELPEPGRKVAAGEECAVVESVKAASDLYSPLSGEIVEVNAVLNDAPESINDDPYGAWIFRIQPQDPGELDNLLDADAYQATLAED